MKPMTTTEKKKITQDWKDALGNYEIYKPMHLIKRNGPVLSGVYLKPVYSGEHYVPVFHTHSLMSPFPAISLSSATTLLNRKGANESISFLRHTQKLQDIVSGFKEQSPYAFIDKLTCSMLGTIYDQDVDTSEIYPANVMKDDVLLLKWCGKESLVESKINKYRAIISQWPEGAKRRFNGEDGWESDVRLQMDIERLKNTVSEELIKFKLIKFTDHGLICD